MQEPKSKKCPEKDCDEIIYGLSEKDLRHKLKLHSIKHMEDKNE